MFIDRNCSKFGWVTGFPSNIRMLRGNEHEPRSAFFVVFHLLLKKKVKELRIRSEKWSMASVMTLVT